MILKTYGVMLLWLLCTIVFAQNNYQYDHLGRLSADLSEGIVSIKWNNHNQIQEIIRADTSHAADVEFRYDGDGRRILKLVKPRGGAGLLPEYTWQYTYYLYDERGNVITSYERNYAQTGNDRFEERYAVGENNLFDSRRLGYAKSSEKLINRSFSASIGDNGRFTNVSPGGTIVPSASSEHRAFRGNRRYELTNHLGSVVAVVTDRAEVLSANNYYPFGMSMQERSFESEAHRYAFGGKEQMDEIKGAYNSYDYGARMYDPRLGRWLSIDPKYAKYAHMSPYNYAANNPELYVDPDGEDITVSTTFTASRYGTVYASLQKTTAYQEIVHKYQQSKKINLTLAVDNNQVPKEFDAVTVNSSYKTKSSYSTNTAIYFSDKPLDNVLYSKVGDAEYRLDFSYTDINLAFIIIHEAVHALIEADQKYFYPKDENSHTETHKKLKTRKDSHSLFNDYHDIIVRALKEYAAQNNLSYTEAQLDDLAWYGTEESEQFKAHFAQLATENQTTPQQEIAKWRERSSKLRHKQNAWQPVKTQKDGRKRVANKN